MNEEKRKLKLLLVDDEPEFRDAARQVLGRRGFVVTEAGSGEDALEKVRDQRPDLILLDLRMEGLDGIETLQQIRAIDPDLPVIILTGHGGLTDAMAGIKLKIADFVQKPVDMERLARRIRILLEQPRPEPLKERTVRDIMVPVGSYARVYRDEPLEVVAETLQSSLSVEIVGRRDEKGHRSVLVFDRNERFVGIVRVEDLLRAAVPPYMRESDHAVYFTGMFLAQTKLLPGLSAGDLVARTPTIGVEACLMEAVHLMASNRLINLPVLDGSELVGVIRDKDVLIEIDRSMSRAGV